VIHRTIIIVIALLTIAAGADAPTQPATRPAGVDEPTWRRILDIDARAGEINDLVADFEQQKFTAMLKKPLTCSGQVFVRGSRMLWETRKPEPGVLEINDREARIYYPSQKTIEVYAIEEKLGQLAASPLPRLSVLREHFSFKPLPSAEMGEADDATFFAVEMTPTEPALREHVDRVRVLLDATRGLIVRFEMLDADGDRTVIVFSNVRANAGVTDAQLTIAAPADVKVTRPLGALEEAPRGESMRGESK
jgi:outer membrane lipoprotein-sorting protein